MSGGYPPQRPGSNSDYSSPELYTQDFRIHYLETRMAKVEHAQEASAHDMAQIKTQITGIHDDIARVEIAVQKADEKVVRGMSNAAGLAKWICGLVCTIGLALGATMFKTCHESTTSAAKTQTTVEVLSKDLRDIQAEFQTIRQVLLTGRNGQRIVPNVSPLSQP